MIFRSENMFNGESVITKESYISVLGEMIKYVGPKLPAGHERCTLVDLGKKTLLPGLIDTHTHIFISDHSYGKNFSVELLRIKKLSSLERIQEARKNARSLLFHGFTAARDLGNSGRYLDEYFSHNEKSLELIYSGPGVSVNRGQFPSDTSLKTAETEYDILGDNNFSKIIEDRRRHSVEWLKIYLDNDPSSGGLSLVQANTLINEAIKQGLKVAAHSTNAMSAKTAVASGIQSLEHGYELDDETLATMKRKNIFLVPTDFGMDTCKQVYLKTHHPDYKNCNEYIKKRSMRLLKAHLIGVPIAFGSDAYLKLHSPLNSRGAVTLDALFSYVQQGLSPEEVIRMATANAAKLLGREDLGQIKVGKRADFLIVNKNPMEKIENLKSVSMVVSRGEIICGLESQCLGDN